MAKFSPWSKAGRFTQQESHGAGEDLVITPLSPPSLFFFPLHDAVN
jgi:hypothetical protein